jgi:spore coat polysaccharide biosynthesis protein SpsF (cytidylyltransferase family)
LKHQNSKIVAIIQARIGATRLPEKILKDVSGKPMLWHVVNRLKFSQTIDDIVLAIPTSDQNDMLEDFAQGLKLHCFRGSETDVLSRYYGAAVEFGGDVIVRITSDCPLIDPRVTDHVIDAHLNSGADYTTNDVEYGFPRGLDTEALNFDTLARAYKEAKLDYEREHVTPYIYQHPDIFKLNFVEAKGKLRRPDLRLTVDTEEDLEFIREIYKRLYRDDQIFYTEDIIELLDKYPELTDINAHVRQKELGE